MQELTVDSESSDLPENTEARMVAPEQQLGEQFDQSLRPERLRDYIGQQEIKDNLLVFIGAAKKTWSCAGSCTFERTSGIRKNYSRKYFLT